MATMSRDLEDFKSSGPVYLSSINWRSSDHQRIVMASLVKATYVLEEDSQKNRVGPKALAPAWWQHFNFECTKKLEDNSRIFGCIYELKLPFCADPSAPRFVVTFRGTMLDRRNAFKDNMLNLFVIFGGINRRTRVKTAIISIDQLIRYNGGNTRNIWVGGHSLGASIATVAGKCMAKEGIYLNTFLFNPPFASIPLDRFPILDDKLKERLHICKAKLKMAAAIRMKDYHNKTREEFSKLASWIPYLFVNPGDPICKSYMWYFNERLKMKEGIMGHIGQVETRTAFREMCGDVFGLGSELSHLLPSARLAVNRKELKGFLEPHGILQWWERDISLEFSDYNYQPDTS